MTAVHRSRVASILQLGIVVLAFLIVGARSLDAQINLAGVWSNRLHEDWLDRLDGPELGDYGGIPLNAAARLRAQSWDAALLTVPEYQCRVHPSDYASSFGDIRIWEEVDTASQQLVAIH